VEWYKHLEEIHIEKRKQKEWTGAAQSTSKQWV
jgi:hypothetical protein